MKVDFSLKPQHQLILQVLREAKELPVSDLAQLCDFFGSEEVDIDRILRWIKRLKDPLWNEPLMESLRPAEPAIERDIKGLEFLDLVYVSRTSSSVVHSFRKNRGIEDCNVSLTEEGTRVAERIHQNRRLLIRPRKADQTNVFIACAFGKDDIDELFNKHLEPACVSVGYTPNRVDLNEPPLTITEEIMSGIMESACVIADLSYARPSVYYEVGLAHGMGIPLLLCCRKDHYRGEKDNQRVHFDLEQFKISYWSPEDQGGYTWDEKMDPRSRLEAILKDHA